MKEEQVPDTRSQSLGYRCRFLEELSRADVALEITAATLEEVFAGAWREITALMVARPERLRGVLCRTVELAADSAEELLHEFLELLVVLKDTERAAFLVRTITVRGDGRRRDGRRTDTGGQSGRQGSRGGYGRLPGGWRLRAELSGDRLDGERYELAGDLKAVTWHEFRLHRLSRLSRHGGLWRATVVVDV